MDAIAWRDGRDTADNDAAVVVPADRVAPPERRERAEGVQLAGQGSQLPVRSVARLSTAWRARASWASMRRDACATRASSPVRASRSRRACRASRTPACGCASPSRGVRRSGRGAAAVSSAVVAGAARRGGGRGRGGRAPGAAAVSVAPCRVDRAGRFVAGRDRGGDREIARRPVAARRARGPSAGDRAGCAATGPSAGAALAIRSRNSLACLTTISAACDGVAARTSATKSAMVVSVSWPMARDHGHRAGCDRARHAVPR